VAVSFIGGGTRSTWRKPPTYRKSLTNFITQCCIEYTVLTFAKSQPHPVTWREVWLFTFHRHFKVWVIILILNLMVNMRPRRKSPTCTSYNIPNTVKYVLFLGTNFLKFRGSTEPGISGFNEVYCFYFKREQHHNQHNLQFLYLITLFLKDRNSRIYEPTNIYILWTIHETWGPRM